MALGLKIGVIATWLVAATGFLFPPETTFGTVGRALFWLLIVVHAVECAVFYGTLKRTGRPIAFELLQTMLFGVIHYGEAKVLAEAASPSHAADARDGA